MLWTVAKEAAENWSSHKDARQGAALAYYSVFSLGPIIAAIGVVVQLKDALNTVWEVGETPGSGVWHFVRNLITGLSNHFSDESWVTAFCMSNNVR